MNRVWGREVTERMVRGTPHRVFARRPGSLNAVLRDARRWAERDYLVQGDVRISYPTHEAAVAELGTRLQAMGVRTGDRVLIAGSSSAEWVIAAWAAVTIKAIAVACNSWWSDSQLLEVVRATQPTAAVGDSPAGLPSISFADVAKLAGNVSASTTLEAIDDPGEEAPAFVIFTAGTTGEVKGAVLTHGSLVASVQNMLAPRGLLPGDISPDRAPTVALMTLPLFHIGGITTMMANLVTGGRLVFAPGRFDPEHVIRLIESERISSWGAIPTMVSRVVSSPSTAGRNLSSLRTLTIGGAPVPQAISDSVRKVLPSVRLGAANTYGLTEAGGHVATSGGRGEEPRGSSGRALPTVEISIAIRSDAPLGSGEILVRSPSNMAGYWGDSESSIDPDGWLHTGDLGRLDGQGYLFVTGRAKDIVIRGGENVSITGVEATLLRHSAIDDVAVIGLPHDDLGEEVAAVVVVSSGSQVTPAELEEFARKRLSKFEVPTKWWIRRAPLPLNEVGKVLRRELRATWPSLSAPVSCGGEASTKVRKRL